MTNICCVERQEWFQLRWNNRSQHWETRNWTPLLNVTTNFLARRMVFTSFLLISITMCSAHTGYKLKAKMVREWEGRSVKEAEEENVSFPLREKIINCHEAQGNPRTEVIAVTNLRVSELSCRNGINGCSTEFCGKTGCLWRNLPLKLESF